MQKRKVRGLAIIGLPVAAISLMAASDSYFEVSKNLEIFSSLYKELNIYYVDEVDANKAMRSAIDAMLNDLDPYTNFISEAEMEGYRFQTTGRYGGIGAVIRTKDEHIGIIEVHEGGPADKSELLAGDILLEIDGRSTKDRTTEEVSKLLKGQPGTDVDILVARETSGEEFTVTISREEIKIKNVPYYGMARDGIGYIRLEQFTEKAGAHVQDALEDLRDNNSLRGLILDLRGNPGGLLHEAVNVANTFIPKGKLVVDTKGRVSDWDQKRRTLSEPIDTDIPLAILTDGSSASASEIVAGVIQDYDRGVVLGRRTFGKGLVQQTRDLSYKTKLKLTIAKYYTPSGRCIQALDYSNRGEDGSVPEIADSLRGTFKTSNGRIVFDGAGIEPDVRVEKERFAQIAISLLSKDLIFDFATEYANENASLTGGSSFNAEDDLFEAFAEFLEGKDYSYKTQSEKAIERLEKEAEKEHYEEALSEDIANLKSTITIDKERDLQKHKEQIKEALEAEIVSRYYYRSGRIEASFDDDPDIQEAVALLNNAELYKQLLTP